MQLSGPRRWLLSFATAFTLAFLYLPLAAAFATVPVFVMVFYLLGARRLGAFDSL